MVTATHPPESTKYNQEGLIGHTTKRIEKRMEKKVLGKTRWGGCCVEPDGKEWMDQGKKNVEMVTHRSIRMKFKPTIWCGDRGDQGEVGQRGKNSW